ncbi:MAG: protein phosphatase 2C domain-containing protein [Desulfobacterales bacterium]|jgi:protein phosphatase
MIIVESASITDKGKKRKTNEDALILEDALGLYVVADGMGGHRAGDLASRLVVTTIGDFIKKAKANEDSDHTADVDDTLSCEANLLLGSIRRSNQVVHEASLANSSYRGMGSTVSAVYFTESTLIAANVGDSPIYLVRDGKIKLLSVPHTFLEEQKALNPEKATKLGVEFRHVLTRAVGTEKSLKTDIYEIQCFRDDIVVISSDGLNDKVPPQEILELTCNNRPDAACHKLVKLANDRGGDDNITVIVLKVKLVKNSRHKINRFLALIKQNSFNILKKLKYRRTTKCQI